MIERLPRPVAAGLAMTIVKGMYKRSTQRAIISILLACFCFVFVVASIGGPRPVLALPAEVTADAPAAVAKVEASFGNQILASAIIGLLNAITLMGQQVARDLAVGLASGCRGENACAFTKDPGTYFTAVAYDGAGEFIGNLSESWEFLGFSLCNPRIPDVGLSIALGLAEKFQRPKPKCDFVNTINNWQNVAREARDPHALLKHASLAFEPGNTDLGQAATASQEFQIHIKRKEEAEKQKRTEGGGILPQSGIISGNVTTPAAVIKAEYEDLPRSGKDNTITSGDVVSGLIGTKSGGIWSAVGTTVLSTFVNTLASRLLKSALSGLFGETANDLPDLTQAIGNAFGGGAGRQAAPGLSQTASALLTPQIRVSNGGFEYVSELAAGCQAKPEERSQFQCTIDNKFMVAIQQSQAGSPLTVAEAIDKGYLNRGGPFGFTNPAGTPPSEPSPQEGYPYSSMKKLRLLRIIPLGWEFAALKIDKDNQSATLGDVVDGYTKEGDSAGCQGVTADPQESRFCGLIDPNWVLKAPPATCGAIVWSSMVAPAGGGRQEVCADLKHCVAEAASGDCQAWGYCTREKNTWRFDADSCDKQYASCDTFNPSEGSAASLLENTVDFGACTANNAGCTGFLAFQSPVGTWNPASPAVYLDRDAAKCDQSVAGCTEFVVPANANLNFVQNSGFETTPGSTGVPFPWSTADATWGSLSQDGTQSFEGRGAVHPDTSEGLIQSITVVGGRTYTLSAYAKGSAQVRIGAQVFDGGAAVPMPAANTNCTLLASTQPGLQFTPETVAGNAQTFVRQSCTFTPTDNVDRVLIRLESSAADVYVDAVQLEEGTIATAYHSGYATGVQKLHYRIPPDYLGCTGEAADRSECAEYSRYCRREETGCELYTPATRDAAVSGVASALDRCPGECVGYDSYLKLGSRFEPQFTKGVLEDLIPGYSWRAGAPEEDLYPLIPRTSTACPAQFAGCDEFTNLRTEAREYYSDLRACQTPSPDSQTYFTWEGSDTTGYQLKTWSLKRSNTGALTGATGDELAPGQVAGNVRPPCTNYAVATSGDGNITVTCTDTSTNQASCNPATSENPADCRAFYDSAGNIYRRLMPRTIVSTQDCQSFRWTGLPRLPEISPATDENADELRIRLEKAACDASHGFWNLTTRQCLYLGAPTLSQACPAQLNGCRGFRGNTSANMEIVFGPDTFEGTMSLVEQGWSAIGGGGLVVSLSPEALAVGTHSLKVANAIGQGGTKRSLADSARMSPTIEPNATYFVRFLAKGTAGARMETMLRASVAIGGGVQQDNFDEVVLTPEWQRFELGPLTMSNINQQMVQTCTLASPATASTLCPNATTPQCTVSRGQQSCTYLIDPQLIFRRKHEASVPSPITFFLDDVQLTRVRDAVYLVKHSSVVPISCDTLPAASGGGYSRGAMLGCRSYTDRANAAHTLKSFTSLCRAQSAGCTDLIDTRNSDSPFIEQFNTVNSGVCRGNPGLCNLGIDADGDGTFEPGALVALGNVSGGDAVCTIAAGATSCTYGPGVADSARNIRADDRLVPADIHRYVVVDPAKACQAAQAGCQALWNVSGGQSSTVYRKNNPNEYGASLCTFEARGCETWTRSDSSVAYFRAPEAGGCVWKTNTAIGTTQYSGWFKAAKQAVGNQTLVNTQEKCKGYGTWDFVRNACIDTNGNSLDGVGDNRCGGVACDVSLCTRGAGGSWKPLTATTGQCESEAPCYGVVIAETVSEHPRIRVDVANTYLIGGTTFGIWRNADAKYAGAAGTCPAAQATCTALLDPTDKSQDPDGTAYYLKDNARLQAAREECDGKVSRAQGCVVLKNEEDPANLYSAEQSYLASDRERGDAVPPVALPPVAGVNQNDVNTIIKVQRDRICAEWFQCASAEFKWIDEENRYKTVCNILGRCNAAAATPEEGGSINTCGSWIRRPLLNKPPQIDASACTAANWSWDGVARRCTIPSEAACTTLGGTWFAGPPTRCELGALKEPTYRLRDRTFGGQDYTGYSIPNLYGIDQIKEVNIGGLPSGTAVLPRYRLGFVIPGSSCTSSPAGTFGAMDDACGVRDDGIVCTRQGQCARAFNVVGWQPADAGGGGFEFASKYCRGYPERTSPFPDTESIRTDLHFENAPRCTEEDGDEFAGNKCECDYVKAEYGSGTRYYPLNSPIQSAFCEGSDGNVTAEVNPEDCQAAGNTWQTLKKSLSVYGWPGYCLEFDPSRLINSTQNHKACLTWFPIDQLSSAQDIDNLHVSASYTVGNPDSLTRGQNGAYYCLAGGEVEDPSALSWGNPYVPGDYTTIGNFNGTDAAETTAGASGGQIRVKTANVLNLDIYRTDIKHIRIHVQSMGGDGGAANGCYEYDVGEQSNDRLTTPRDCSTGELRELTGDDRDSFEAYDFRLPPSNEWWWWGGDDNWNDGASSRYGDGRYVIANTIVPTHLEDTAGAHSLDQPDWSVGCAAGGEDYDGGFVGFRFDPDTQQLTHVRTAVCTKSGWQGGNIGVRLFLHPHCDYLAKIDDSLGARGSAPDTACLDPGLAQGSSGNGTADCPLSGLATGIEYDPSGPPYLPYGSSSAGVGVNPGDHQWYLNHNRMEDEMVDDSTPLRTHFAGWPFACLDGARAGGSVHNCTVNSNLLATGGPGGRVTSGVRTPLTNETWNSRLEGAENEVSAVSEFSSIFARSHEVFRWNGSQYVEDSTVKWDVRTAANTAPQFRAVGGSDDAPMETPSSGGPLSANGLFGSGALVQGVNGFLLTNVKFWAWAHRTHLPLTKFNIDWGDGETTSTGTGLYKNARANCDGSEWGMTGAACQEEPYNFEHLYACGGIDDPNWCGPGRPCDCPVADFQSLYGGCCVFKPKVQTIDNWGACNGTCPGSVSKTAEFGGGDYGDGSACFESECTEVVSSTNNPWSAFAGEIVVAP